MGILLLGFACPFLLDMLLRNTNTTPAYLMLMENVSSFIVNHFSLSSQQLNRVTYFLSFG